MQDLPLWKRALAIALTMVAAFVGMFGVSIVLARQASAAPAQPAVVPSGCYLHWNNPLVTRLSNGTVVSANAGNWGGDWAYSQSGASRGFVQDLATQNDGHRYRISIHRYVTSTGTIYKLAGGDFYPLHGADSGSYSPPLWGLNNNYTYAEIAGYDVNRPAAGFHSYAWCFSGG